MKIKLGLLLLLYLQLLVNVRCQSKPNIIVIMADDMGWDDVSFHGNNEIPTPNIDAIAYYGRALNRHYAPSMCTPSRGSFFTGKLPIHLGLQRYVIQNEEPWGLGLEEKILPQYLKEVGYKNYLVGKWHLGYFQKSYNPMQRGFDKFYGYLGGFINYYKHEFQTILRPKWPAGYDMRNNEDIDYSSQHQYATDLFTDKTIKIINEHNVSHPMFLCVNHLAPHSGNPIIPFEVPEYAVHRFKYILNPVRKKLATAISIVDDSVGKIIRALDSRHMLNNSVILFYSDNGAPSKGEEYNEGSNFPFKGQKDSPWEGGSRIAAAIWSPHMEKREEVSNDLLHVSDWLPTFCKLAGVNLTKNHDGFDVWNTISNGSHCPRTSIVHNIDEYISYTKGSYKYVKGNRHKGVFDWWLGDNIRLSSAFVQLKPFQFNEINRCDAGLVFSKYSKSGWPMNEGKMNEIRRQCTIHCYNRRNICFPAVMPCLFNIENDPCENNNLYFWDRVKWNEMEHDIAEMRKTVVPSRYQPGDYSANPAYHNYTWTWWRGD